MNAVPILVGSAKGFYEKFLEPDVVITLGGVTGDYDCLNRLSRSKKSSLEVWRVNTDGNVIDTYGKLTTVFQMRVEDFFNAFSKENNNRDHEYFNSWLQGKQQTNTDSVDLPLSNMYVAQVLHKKIPANSFLNFAILNSFRSWLYFDIDPSIKSFCNVGAFGIDGCLSTMLGQSFTTDDLCFLITGDLAFYYDMNAIALRHIRNNVRILLINNNGGGEFKINTIHLQTDVSRFIAADNHFKNAKAWVEDNGFIYYSAKTKEELNVLTDIFVRPSDKPIIVEVFAEAENQRIAISKIISSCWNGTTEDIQNKKKKEFVKKTITTMLGEGGLTVIKKTINKIK